eukprot:jgi/Psemu1/17952/gm1.17952_g
MWSFGTKREDTVQVAPNKVPSASDYQEQSQQPLPKRNDSGHRSDTDQQDPPSPKGSGVLAGKSRMFYKNKKLASTNGKSRAKSPGRRPQEAQNDRSNGSQSKNFMSKRFGRGSKNNINEDDYLQDVSVNETSNGIEVSFPGSESATKSSMKVKPVISLKEKILERQRVYKSQFSTVASTSANLSSSATDKSNWRPKGHRIPLLGITAADTAYAEAVQLLKDAPVVDEQTAVQQELMLLETEISSLERDRIWLNQSINGKGHGGSDISGMNKENVRVTWDAHKLLKDDAVKKQPLPASERNTLQKHRGNSLTFHLTSPRIHDIFVHNLCGKQQSARITNLSKHDGSVTTIMPSNNRSADSAATNLQHVSFLSSTNTTTTDPGLYLCRDVGQSQIIGNLPHRLSQRLQQREGNGAERPEVGELMYLSTGSRGSYFAKFQSGECWWGSAAEDADFQFIMESWDVYRVAFGPIETIKVSTNNNSYKDLRTSSWIILSHDGSAAWKNLPSRLSNTLEHRLANAAAPVEVSLGPGDSYFVRFLDSSIDYSLPSKVALACEQIEERGGQITNVCLHPEISQNFIIRHTELTR